MKKLAGILAFIGLCIFLIIACDNADENNTTDSNETTNTLDTLAEDSEFIALLETTITTYNNTSDLGKIQELVNKASDLTDSEKMQVATTFGFNSLESYEEFAIEYTKLWSSIIERFDLSSEDNDSVAKIYADRLFQVKIENPKTTQKTHTSPTKRTDECASDDTQCICRVNFNTCVQNIFGEDWYIRNLCQLNEQNEFVPDEVCDFNLNLYKHMLCLTNYECCLIGWDSEECAAIFVGS